MSALLTTWYDDILPDLSGLTPGNQALKLIRDAVIEFLEKSQVYVIDHPPIDLVADTDVYAYAPGAGLVVVAPKHVMVDGATVNPATEDELDQTYGDDWRNGDLASSTVAAYLNPDDGHIQLVPPPAASLVGGLVMRTAVTYNETITQVDDRLRARKQYRDAIAACAKWRAMATMNKPYSSPSGAGYWMQQYNLLVGGADIHASKGFNRRPLRSGVVYGIK